MTRVKWKRYAKCRTRSRDRKVLEPSSDKLSNLIASKRWLDQISFSLIEILEKRFVFFEPEKVILLREYLGRLFVDRAVPLWREIRRLFESFASDTVCSLIFAKVDITSIIGLLEHILHRLGL